GKLEITPTKPLTTQRDLSLAYSPGVAVPVLAIAKDPQLAYDYTNKGNLVAVVSNGTAILGLGNLGAQAAKPVMEGKGALFKRFADIDAIDILVDTPDVDAVINCVRYLGPTFGGINLEDIKAPDCFIIEEKLKELLDIPVFHDDQHGTAIIAAAGLLNALELTGRTIDKFKLVVNGAGAASIACMELLTAMGMPKGNMVLCDTKGVIYRGRKEGMNQWKSTFAVETKARSLADALKGADAFFGLSAAGTVTQDMVKSMAKKPIIFAMANPDPEITPEDVAEVRSDAIVATGRSDYPNQINNVLGFPFIFRGALDVHASTINEAMKIAAAKALAELAREDVPDQVAAAFLGRQVTYGPDYIIPAPFDPRLITHVPPAVAKAAMDTGVARKPIVDMDRYIAQLSGRLDPVAGWLHSIFAQVRNAPKRIIFAEGEQPQIARAANAFQNSGLGRPILIGRHAPIKEAFASAGIGLTDMIEMHDTSLDARRQEYAEFLFSRLQRKGYLLRDCQRLVNNDRNVFAACMVALGHADGMVTGVTRNWTTAYEDVRKVLDARPRRRVIGVSIALIRGRAVLVADVAVHDMPDSTQLADIAEEAVRVARRLGIEPRVAFLAYSTFGQPRGERSDRVREAVSLLDQRQVDFEYDGDMAADVALNREAMRQYPFCRLSDTANVLVMPAFHSAAISTKMLKELGGATLIGPMLVGLSHSVQICPLGAKDSDVVNMAALAAYDVNG
ncbi:MAG TPA: NADP-dependent malic enzyme, partial [Hyphomicrobiaceae bacterium]|nr:NADP-dependent malic enzyme [Hyphomicrobiaceae bacterium]